MYDVEGNMLRRLKLLRINDLALTRDGQVMVTVNQEKIIKVQRLADNRDVRDVRPSAPSALEEGACLGVCTSPQTRLLMFSLRLDGAAGMLIAAVFAQLHVSVMESAPIMSMALSPDNSFILVNLASHTIHLWPMEPMLRQLNALHSGQISPGTPRTHLCLFSRHILLGVAPVCATLFLT